MSEHIDRLTLILYIENDGAVDRIAVVRHLAECLFCQLAWEELQAKISLLGDGSIFSFIDDPMVTTDRTDLWKTITTQYDREQREAAVADTFYAELRNEPIPSWRSILATHPEYCTAAMVQRMVRDVETELDRNLDYALVLLGIAEAIAAELPGEEKSLQLGHVWKQRSNAFRMLAKYEDAVDAAIIAEKLYRSVRTGDFEVGQAQYTLAVALFKMTRYEAALEALSRSRATLSEYGITAPLAKTIMLDAVIRVEQGNVRAARDTFRELLPLEERLGQHTEVARVRANLAECNLRLGDFDAALVDAREAIILYQALNNEAECTRTEWTIAMIRLSQGEAEAIDNLFNVASRFEQLGMIGDAGFVKLDITEELLRRAQWSDAERIARDLVTLFSTAKVTLASVHALDYLRQAIVNKGATPEIVRYVRVYVTADDPLRPFTPPNDAIN